MRISKELMNSAGKEQEGAALLISRMLLRLETKLKQIYINKYIYIYFILFCLFYFIFINIKSLLNKK